MCTDLSNVACFDEMVECDDAMILWPLLGCRNLLLVGVCSGKDGRL